jgi:hypothetical protein
VIVLYGGCNFEAMRGCIQVLSRWYSCILCAVVCWDGDIYHLGRGRPASRTLGRVPGWFKSTLGTDRSLYTLHVGYTAAAPKSAYGHHPKASVHDYVPSIHLKPAQSSQDRISIPRLRSRQWLAYSLQ